MHSRCKRILTQNVIQNVVENENSAQKNERCLSEVFLEKLKKILILMKYEKSSIKIGCGKMPQPIIHLFYLLFHHFPTNVFRSFFISSVCSGRNASELT